MNIFNSKLKIALSIMLVVTTANYGQIVKAGEGCAADPDATCQTIIGSRDNPKELWGGGSGGNYGGYGSGGGSGVGVGGGGSGSGDVDEEETMTPAQCKRQSGKAYNNCKSIATAGGLTGAGYCAWFAPAGAVAIACLAIVGAGTQINNSMCDDMKVEMDYVCDTLP